jgi:cell division protein FtsB
MTQRLFVCLLLILLLAIQYPLWLGKGSYRRIKNLESQLKIQSLKNKEYLQRNQALQADVEDLKVGLEVMEEKARYQLGYIKSNEIFFQVLSR